MGKILVIAEKPSVARDIARVMKCGAKGDGFLYSEEMIVSWALGHLVTLAEPDDYDPALKSWRLKSLPIVPEEIKLKPIAKTKKQLAILKNLMLSKEVDSLICATDSGREGELIFRYIYSFTGCRKPFQRLWISSMTDAAIREGFSRLKQGSFYDNLYMSAKCRSEADWLVGINASRAFTLRYNALLTIGRVQTPTLAILVEKQKEISAFVSKDYWELRGTFHSSLSENGVFETYQGLWTDAEKKETKIFEKERAAALLQLVEGKTGRVAAIEMEEKRQPPWLLYDLTELQRDCNKKFGYTAQKTLSIAQDLYEKRKLITYPRTDSRHLSEDMTGKIKSTLAKLCFDPYREYAEQVLSLPSLPLSKRIIDNSKVTDHHAIIPTDGHININILGPEEKSVYDLIVRRFISVFYPPYIYSVTKIITEVEGENFITKGTTVMQTGFMELYKNDKKEGEEAILPKVKEGEECRLTEAELLQKKTQPPKPYTEATLLSAMENAGRFIEDEALKEMLKDSGLGTPATRAAIIERLLQVGYIIRKGRALMPTEKGMKLIEVVPAELSSPETTGKWEKGLASIAAGKMESSRFMGSIIRYVNYLVESSAKVNREVIFPEEKRGKK